MGTPSSNLRLKLTLLSAIADVSAALVAYGLALFLHHVVNGQYPVPWAERPDWSVPVTVFVILGAFLAVGLYKAEVYISRPVHAYTLCKGTTIAVVLIAFIAFALKAPVVTESRFTVFTMAMLFLALSASLRFFVLDRMYREDARSRPGATLIIGQAHECERLAEAVRDLRGLRDVRRLIPKDLHRNGHPAEPELVEALRVCEPAPRQVFIEPGSVGHRATLDLAAMARRRGAEVYIVGRLVGPLDSTRLLARLFEVPAMHVRHDPGTDEAHGLKCAFDVAAAGAALVVLSPVLAVIAVAIRLDSSGPVLFRQERIGRRGRPFAFLKFRSMQVGNDSSAHKEYVRQLIEGEADIACIDENGEPILKLTNDERVTRVGRVLRKYSLDELPQLWNVIRGDMSVVGPRPALGYEVEAYKDWHKRRLLAVPGLSGLWQVAGRSRVTFDEMVFQDVVYTCNQSVLTDLTLCLRTVPVVLQGRGAA